MKFLKVQQLHQVLRKCKAWAKSMGYAKAILLYAKAVPLVLLHLCHADLPSTIHMQCKCLCWSTQQVKLLKYQVTRSNAWTI